MAFSRQLGQMDHYQVLEVPRAATRAQIVTASEDQKKRFDSATYPPVVRDALKAIDRRIDVATFVLKDANRRSEYDRLMAERSRGAGDVNIHQRLQQRSIAEQNFNRARELAIQGDYYGAIVLLKQAVEFQADNAQAWFLLGSCQERNPKWRRTRPELQMALRSIRTSSTPCSLSAICTRQKASPHAPRAATKTY